MVSTYYLTWPIFARKLHGKRRNLGREVGRPLMIIITKIGWKFFVPKPKSGTSKWGLKLSGHSKYTKFLHEKPHFWGTRIFCHDHIFEESLAQKMWSAIQMGCDWKLCRFTSNLQIKGFSMFLWATSENRSKICNKEKCSMEHVNRRSRKSLSKFISYFLVSKVRCLHFGKNSNK